MNPLSILSDYGGAIGAIGSGFLNYFGQNSANQANRDIANSTNMMNRNIAREQMQFQERMSNTSYQRAVGDLKLAGLNPILAYAQGGASSPPGAAVGAVSGPAVENKFARASESFNSAIQARIATMQLKNLEADLKTKDSQTRLNDGLVESAFADQVLKLNNASVARQTAKNLGYQASGLKAESDLDSTVYGTASRVIKRFAPFLHGAKILHSFGK